MSQSFQNLSYWSRYQRLILPPTLTGIHPGTPAHKTELECVWKLKNNFSLLRSYSCNNHEANRFRGKFALLVVKKTGFLGWWVFLLLFFLPHENRFFLFFQYQAFPTTMVKTAGVLILCDRVLSGYTPAARNRH